jgi:pimeloyl-ACP methyl ester carboxylesterase
MERTRSADGTGIAVEREGAGPPVVLTVGALCDRRRAAPMAALLASGFEVFRYDRRSRGDSDVVAPGPDAVERELEDLAAVIAVAGGSPAVYGHSSGAILALEAAARGLPVSAVAAYEPPWATDSAEVDESRAREIRAAVEEGRPDAAIRLFVGGSAEPLAAEGGPAWAGMRTLARALPFDLALGGGLVPERIGRIRVPVLVLDGGESWPWIRRTADVVADLVPGAGRRTIPGEAHAVDHGVVAPVVRGFFAG